MYGKSVYERWVELYGIEQADVKMQEYVEKHKKSHSLEKNGMYGKKQTDETKKLISERAKSRTGKKASRYIRVDEKKLNEMIKLGYSIKNISKELNVSQYVVRNRIKEIINV